MKKLKRLLLIHWYKYQLEVIDFGNINFLTGKTASGKSTIIDALQLVLLGDTTGTFFNKAANQKSNRTLQSYLFGENGDDGDVGYRYLREGPFTSYVAVEFYDTEKEKSFVTGIICDCYKDQTYDYKWFVINGYGFPKEFFINSKNSTPYNIKELRIYLNSWLKSKTAFELCETNKRYQEVTLGKFGQIKSKYRTLLRKAVPFTPISDIEKFVTESICDVKNDINVEQMQSDIRQYRNLENDAQQINKRIDSLSEISEINQKYESEKLKHRLQSYIVDRAEKEQYCLKEKKYHEQIEEWEEQITSNKLMMEELWKEKQKLEQEFDQLNEEYRTSDITKREKDLREDIKQLRERISQYENKVNVMCNCIQQYGRIWKEQLQSVIKQKVELEDVDVYISLFQCLETISLDELKEMDITTTMEQMSNCRQQLNDILATIKKECNDIKNVIDKLEVEIRGLREGIKPYPKDVSKLKNIISSKLNESHKRTIPVNILADVLEIRDERWRNAIEGYLDKQKFYLLVDQEYYQEAVIIYDQVKETEKINDVGIIDLGKLRKEFDKCSKENSLAIEIETEHSGARLYVNYLLGDVIKCDSVTKLREYRMSITADGMLYKGYVVRHMNPDRYKNPYIGRHSMQVLLERKLAEQNESKKEYSLQIEKHRVVKTASYKEIMNQNEVNSYLELLSKDEENQIAKKTLSQKQSEYDQLDFTYLEKIKKQLGELKDRKDSKDREYHGLDKDNGINENEIHRVNTQELPNVIDSITKIDKQLEEGYDLEWRKEIGEKRFFQELETGKSPESIRSGYWSAVGKTNKSMAEYRIMRTEKRGAYNTEFKMSYSVETEENEAYDQELQELSDVRLPEYITKIRDAKEKAYTQFRDDFIAKMKSNIETVIMQVKELNDSLKHSIFGTDSYRFEYKPRVEYKRYYDMITDPLLMDTGGYNIATESFNAKYQNEIKELFQQLIMNETNVSAERRAEYEKSIRKFTDYKTYLVFDLMVKNDQGDEQRLSKTLLKKSGGETQIPFYIALLASFSQVCRIRSKNNNNTIRIIILDEAFSKMDGERIKESIRLLRKFGLQAIFSAPPEKIADIAPLVDRNIAVFKDAEHSFTKTFDPKDVDESLMEEAE